MRILVIGGSAFIGLTTVRRLAATGHEVAVFNRGKRKAEFPEGVARITGDRNKLPDHRAEILRFKPDAVLDMMLLSAKHAADLLSVFDGAASRIVGISSMDAYRAFGIHTKFEQGEPDPNPLTEDSPVRTKKFLYREMAEHLRDYEKIDVENVLLASRGVPALVLRLPAVYGPLDWQHRLFPILKRVDDRRKFILLGNDEAACASSHAFVGNVARAIELALTAPLPKSRLFNVADRDPLTGMQWTEAVAKAAGFEGEILVLPRGKMPAHLDDGVDYRQHMAADSGRIRRELGFDDEYDLSRSIAWTVEWERANPPAKAPESAFDYAAEDAAAASI